MDIFGIFELFDRGDNTEAHVAAPSHYAILERKIDLLLRELHVDTSSLADDVALPSDVRDLLAQGRKIEAIKLYREHAAVGLKEAKDALDGHGNQSPWFLLERKLDLILKEFDIEDASSPVAASVNSPHGATNEVEALIRGGNLIGAIKVYREQTGASLREAKEAVEKQAARIREGGR